MFDIPDEKIFMDSIHGYISVPKCFVRHLIDTEAFQRLRNIDQTGMRTLYPNARHDRFSHSLGVFHLGCKAVDALLANFRRDDYWHIRSDKTKDIFWAKNKVLFLIACLLHDIGHTPFSHSMEKIVLQNSGRQLSITDLCKRLIKEEDWDENEDGIASLKSAAHEQIGAMYILDHMTKNIERVFDDLIEKHYPSVRSEHLLYAEHYREDIWIDKTDLRRDICFIARMIIGFKYKGHTPEKQIRNCFIELLNGSIFDVDKLDYVVRDTKESGISNTTVDVERLLDSLSIITKTRYIGLVLGEPEKQSVATFRDRVILQMSGSAEGTHYIGGHFSGTILIKNGSTVTIEARSSFSLLVPVEHALISYPDDVPSADFSADTNITQAGSVINTRAGCKTLETKNGSAFDCTITNATLLDKDFKFTVLSSEVDKTAMRLQVNGRCQISIIGAFEIPSPFNCFEMKTYGKMDKAVFLGNLIQDQVPDTKKYNEFSVGFKKKAINVIANVLEARNYLYLWIYAHHKVMYYANFLIPALAHKALCTPGADGFPKWMLRYEDIEYLDDTYVWTAIKVYYHLHKAARPEEENPWVSLCQELLTRRYKFSLCKSLAEVDVLLSEFSDRARMSLKKHLSNECRTDYPYVSEESISAGYLKEDVVKRMKELGAPEEIKDIIYLDASYKAGKSNANETFIVMRNEVIPMSEIPLLSKQGIDPRNTEHYFYLYYSTDTTDPTKFDHEARALRDAVKKYAREIVDNGTEESVNASQRMVEKAEA